MKPATLGEIALGVTLLLVLCLLAILIPVIAWRNRDRLKAWRARRVLARQQRAAEAEYQSRLRTYERDVATYRAAAVAWSQNRDHLAALAQIAATHEPSPDPTLPIRLKRGETCYGGLPATMVEERSRDGGTVLTDTSTGEVMVTSHRLVFSADKNREWFFDKLLDIQHQTPDLTLLTVSNRKSRSGVRFTRSSADRFRLLLELARADAQGERTVVVSHYRNRLDHHDRTRPTPPTPPQKPPSIDQEPAPATRRA